jgi:hypothetical protein
MTPVAENFLQVRQNENEMREERVGQMTPVNIGIG